MIQHKERRILLMSSPRTLKVGVKIVRTIFAASTACKGSRLGISSGKMYFTSSGRADGFGATA